MTRDDIIRWAKEAGWKRVGRNSYETGHEFPVLIGMLERFAELHKQQLIREGWRQCAEGQSTTQYCAIAEAAMLARNEQEQPR